MIFVIQESGPIRGGSLVIDLNPIDDIYDVHYEIEVKIGKKIFGKWIPLPSFTKSGNTRVAKQYLSEDFIKNNDSFAINGLTFVRKALDWVTAVTNGGLIDIFLAYDGNDPIDVTEIEIVYLNYNIIAVKT